MSSCSIKQCSARRRKNQPALSFHRFPKSEVLLRKWLKAIGDENINARHKDLFICSLHFEESQFSRTLDVIRLRDNAVPTLFNKVCSVHRIIGRCYYQDLLENFVNLKAGDGALSSRCRVCLKPGTVSIFDKENHSDILEALKCFGDVTIEEDDDFPKSLCAKCDMFIKTAMLFKKKAKQTEAALKQYKCLEIDAKNNSLQCPDFGENSDEIDDRTETDVDWQAEESSAVNVEAKVEKQRQKLSPKVTCRICGKIVNRSYYREHLTMHDPNAHQWVCEICGKSFRLRCAYHNHSLRHRNDFPYKCSLCPYKGRYKELLKTHMRTHSGDYRYMCTECPARFIFKSNLNTHMFKHREPQFKCDSCKRAFHSKLFLQRHFEADHLGIRNHVCNICGKAFGYRNAMMKHQRHVHKREKSRFGRMPSYLAENKQQEHSEMHINL